MSQGGEGRGPGGRRAAGILLVLGGIVAASFGIGNAWSDPRDGFKELSDQDRDGDVDIDDLELFSKRKLEKDYRDVDWRSWLPANTKWEKHYPLLLAFVRDYYGITQGDPLAVRNGLSSPSRMALGPDGSVFVSDPKIGSVFRLGTGYRPAAEYRGFQHPVGVLVDTYGVLYVGDYGTNRVSAVDTKGRLLRTIGAGLVRKPADLAMDSDGLLYVADGEASVIWVFKADGTHVRTVRRGGLDRPVAIEIATRTDALGNDVEELYVVDQGNFMVRVYDLKGTLLRSLGGFPKKSGGMFGGMGMGMGGGSTSWNTQGYFVSPQSLLVDGSGSLHVLDTYLLEVQVLDPVTGKYSQSYGTKGTGSKEYRLPVDILLDGSGNVLASDPGNVRVEVIR